MADNKSSGKKTDKPKDLPTKSVDKKNDDKVKGGVMNNNNSWKTSQ